MFSEQAQRKIVTADSHSSVQVTEMTGSLVQGKRGKGLGPHLNQVKTRVLTSFSSHLFKGVTYAGDCQIGPWPLSKEELDSSMSG